MMRFFHSAKFKITALVLAVLLAGAAAASLSHSGASPLSSAAGFVFSPLQKLSYRISEHADGFFSYFRSSEAYRVENEELKAELAQLQKQLADYERMKQKLETSDAFLGLKAGNPDYEFAYGSIISTDISDAYGSFILNCGSIDGVSVNDPVIYDEYVVGIVKKVNTTTCVALSVLDPRVSIGAYELRTGERGFVSGDTRLFRDGLMRMSGLDGKTAVVSGGIVCTSGAGGIFPDDLLIGTVKSVEKDEVNISSYAVIEPGVDVRDISGVFVLTAFAGQGEADDFVIE